MQPHELLTPFLIAIFIGAVERHAAAVPVEQEFGDFGTMTIELLVETEPGADPVPLSTADFDTWWNGARCECGSDAEVAVSIEVSNPPADGDLDLEVWVGSSCGETTGDRGDDCGTDPVARVSLSASKPREMISFDAAELIARPSGTCTKSIEKKRTIWVVHRESEEEKADLSASITDIPADTKPPTALKDVELLGAENRLIVRWDRDSADSAGDGDEKDVKHIQALCSEMTGESIEPKYERKEDLCGEQNAATSFEKYSPEYLCGDADAKSDEMEIPLEGLGDKEIHVRVLVADASRNFTVISPTPEHAHAIASDDFWEVYKEEGGQASTGCTIIPSRKLDEASSASIVALLLIGALFRRRRITGVSLLLVLALLQAKDARAEAPRTPRTPIRPKWSLDFQLGPYTPSIDREFEGREGAKKPFETVFGKSSGVLFQLKIERYLAWPLGQLGFGAGLGFMERSAKACIPVKEDDDTLCGARSGVDRTKFRLIPISVFGVYRFSWLADLGYVPITPYVRAGVSAHYWSASGGDGKTSGEGITYAPLGALGLAVVLDELDSSASENLRAEFGVSHIGLACEVSTTDLLRIGGPDQLRVGDTTWSAGMLIAF